MANDDVNVVIYKILKYLYECIKAGKQPRHEDVMYNASLLRIPEAYWMDILLELNRKGLIRGINSIITKDGTIVTLTDEFGIVERCTIFVPSFNDDGVVTFVDGQDIMSLINTGRADMDKFWRAIDSQGALTLVRFDNAEIIEDAVRKVVYE